MMRETRMPPTMAGSSIPTRRPHNPLVHRTTTTTNTSNTGHARIPWQQQGVGGGHRTKKRNTRTSLSYVLCCVVGVVFAIFITMNYYGFSSITTTTTTTTTGTPMASATDRKEQYGPNQSNSINTTTTTTTNTDGNAVMILAAVPLDSRHVVALWSELECFAAPDARITTVILAAPLWCQPMLDFLIAQVQTRIPQFRSTNTTTTTSTTTGMKHIEARYFTNDRYDVGLWCDGLHSLGFVSSNYHNNNTTTTTTNHNNNNNNNNNQYDNVVLLNDSLFALRPFTAILDSLLQPAQLHDPELLKYSSLTALNTTTNIANRNTPTTSSTQTQKTIHMTSLSYSLTDPEGIWLESVYRGFDRYGIQRYLDHSCPSEGAAHPSFCPHVIDRIEKKRCIINNHEIAIARLFVQDPEDPPAAAATTNRHVVGLYPADVPRSLWKPHLPDYQTWTRHMEYWKDTLVGHMDFPAGKVSKRNAIRRALHDPLLQHCTAHFDRTLLDDHPRIFNFTNGIRTISKH